MQLREAEPVGVEHDHGRRLRHVDADLDDGGADEDLEVAVAEAGHLGVALVGAESPVHEAHAQRRELAAQPGRHLLRTHGGSQPSVGREVGQELRLRLVRVGAERLDVGHDDEGAVAGGRLGADVLPRPRELVRSADASTGAHPARRGSSQVGDVEVGIEDLAERARDRRRGHEQDVGCVALGRERLPLRHAEAVLLVDDDEVEAGERDRLAQQRVRAHDDLRLAVRESLERTASPGRAERARQQGDSGTQPVEEVADGLVELSSQQVGRRQERALPALRWRASARA